QVDRVTGGSGGEPDLDAMRAAGAPADRREVAVLLGGQRRGHEAQARFFGAAPFSGTRIVSTGTFACRTTFSATLPIRRWLSPLRPDVLMTIESARRAASRMHCDASPTSTR